MKRLLTFLLLVPLTACGSQRTKTDHQNAEASAQVTGEAVNSSQYRKSPPDAAKVDQNLILKWFDATDGCVGGANVTPDDPICKKRDALQERLRQHGWCWGAPMDKPAADSDWHRCGTYDSDNISNLEADVQRGMTALRDSAGDRQNEGDDPHANDWFDEKQRPKSPLLQAYENAMEPIYQKIALANVLVDCGIRGPVWQQQMLALLGARQNQSSNEEMRLRLTPTEAAAARRFKQIVVDGEMSFILGGQSKEAACRSIANAPFAANDELFQRQ